MEDDAHTDPYTDDRQIPHQHLIDICKYRQGGACCRYIFFPREKREFYCTKKIPAMKFKIDSESEMTARGNNCVGLPNEKD
ncbi:MAG: hypothetical protein ACXAC5_00740 [Promethearchaeota archaeon]|jgi:hypothetical protein